jgi:SNF2 family DNA or RNA helicase
VLDELPEKIIYEQTVRLSPEAMQVYEAMRTDVESRIKDPSGGKKGRSVPFRKDSVPVDFFAELTRLRLASLSLSLVSDDWKGGSSKTEALLDLLEHIYRVEGNQVLVFSQFTSYLTQIKVELDKRGYRYLYLDGQTELEERRDLVRQFQEGDCPLFLSSLKAGGLGLNLTAANYVIILDPWWNPAIENQAMDRAHRIGQKRTVTVIRLISEHTIEEKILRLHESKQALSDEMLDGTAYSGKLTMDDVLDMVSPFR